MSTTFPVLGGRLVLQNAPFRPTEDPLWLAATMPPLPAGSRVLDAACGCGIAGLALARHQPHIALEALDISPDSTALTEYNAALNSIPATLHTANLLSGKLALPAYDAILCNPPFHAEERGHTSPNPIHKQAHCLPQNHLPLWLQALTDLLTPAGHLHLILHTDCEAELKAFAVQRHTLTLTPLQTHAKKAPKRLLATLQASLTPTVTKLPLLEAFNPQTRKAHLF